MSKLYTVEELKSLKVGDRVITEFKDDEDYFKEEAEVIMIDSDYIYFDDGYDFPFYQTCEVETEFAIQDSGDYVFKVFKK